MQSILESQPTYLQVYSREKALIIAVETENKEIATTLVDQGATAPFYYSPFLIGEGALKIAAEKGNLDMVRILIKQSYTSVQEKNNDIRHAFLNGAIYNTDDKILSLLYAAYPTISFDNIYFYYRTIENAITDGNVQPLYYLLFFHSDNLFSKFPFSRLMMSLDSKLQLSQSSSTPWDTFVLALLTNSSVNKNIKYCLLLFQFSLWCEATKMDSWENSHTTLLISMIQNLKPLAASIQNLLSKLEMLASKNPTFITQFDAAGETHEEIKNLRNAIPSLRECTKEKINGHTPDVNKLPQHIQNEVGL